jgi:hypothetical protein
MKIVEILRMPCVLNNTHESVYQAYHILERVKSMLLRGDSNETILEEIDFMEKYDTKN